MHPAALPQGLRPRDHDGDRGRDGLGWRRPQGAAALAEDVAGGFTHGDALVAFMSRARGRVLHGRIGGEGTAHYLRAHKGG